MFGSSDQWSRVGILIIAHNMLDRWWFREVLIKLHFDREQFLRNNIAVYETSYIYIRGVRKAQYMGEGRGEN